LDYLMLSQKKYSTLQQEPDSGNDAPRHRRRFLLRTFSILFYL
jgi:hypothetical protein